MPITMLENPTVRGLVQPLSVKGYHTLRDCGVYDSKTELIDGLVIEKTSKSPLHTYIVAAFYHFLNIELPTEYCLRKEDPLILGNSEPEPDLSIVCGKPHDFKNEHPHHAELIVEVSFSSLALDREKAKLYATAGIPVYWLVIAENRLVEVYTQAQNGVYASVETLDETAKLHTPWGIELSLAELFDADV